MIFKSIKYVNWEEFDVLDSEAKFWTSVSDDSRKIFSNIEVIA